MPQKMFMQISGAQPRSVPSQPQPPPVARAAPQPQPQPQPVPRAVPQQVTRSASRGGLKASCWGPQLNTKPPGGGKKGCGCGGGGK